MCSVVGLNDLILVIGITPTIYLAIMFCLVNGVDVGKVLDPFKSYLLIAGETDPPLFSFPKLYEPNLSFSPDLSFL